jgi:hypothetical protein
MFDSEDIVSCAVALLCDATSGKESRDNVLSIEFAARIYSTKAK